METSPPGDSSGRIDNLQVLEDRLWREQATPIREQLQAALAEQDPARIESINRTIVDFLSERYKKDPSVQLKENTDPNTLRQALTTEFLGWVPEQKPPYIRVAQGSGSPLLGSPTHFPPPPQELAVATFRHGLIDGEIHTTAEVIERFGITRQRVHQVSERVGRRVQRNAVIREALAVHQK